MIESTPPGTRFPLDSSRDPDIGANSLQNYQLTPNPLFSLVVKESPDGRKHAELLLEKNLDREKQRNHHLILTAVDGGDPVRSGTAQIKIDVTDANDNPPLFTKEIYKIRLLENLPEGSLAFQVKATDSDEGTNADITYCFSHIANSARQTFSLDPKTGDVKITGPLDYEDVKYYEATVEGKDGGGLSAHAKVHIDIIDVNDNAPSLTLLPILNPVPEDSVPSTVIAVINVRDRDSGDNGEVTCNVDGDLPFRLAVSPLQYRAVAAGAAVHHGGEEAAERCSQPRPLRPGSLGRSSSRLIRSLAVSAAGRAASGHAVRSRAAARRGGRRERTAAEPESGTGTGAGGGATV
uniref:Cadherin domain-containing protein n=1 Tax=Anser brachyrhynchus TaxID=132585 RepID=A0A8B9B895_9AVES